LFSESGQPRGIIDGVGFAGRSAADTIREATGGAGGDWISGTVTGDIWNLILQEPGAEIMVPWCR